MPVNKEDTTDDKDVASDVVRDQADGRLKAKPGMAMANNA
jgi:hypothetical protein